MLTEFLGGDGVQEDQQFADDAAAVPPSFDKENTPVLPALFEILAVKQFEIVAVMGYEGPLFFNCEGKLGFV